MRYLVTHQDDSMNVVGVIFNWHYDAREYIKTLPFVQKETAVLSEIKDGMPFIKLECANCNCWSRIGAK